MKRTFKTFVVAATGAVLAATSALATPNCQTRNLSGDWILTLHGSFPDVTENGVEVDHIYIPCDVSIDTSGTVSGTCQDMLAASVGEPATGAFSAQISANSRNCVIGGTGTLNGTTATFEARAVDTGTWQANLIEGTMIITLPQAPLPGINYVVLNTRLIRDPWGGSAFVLDEN